MKPIDWRGAVMVGALAVMCVADAAGQSPAGTTDKKGKATSWDLLRDRDYARALEEFKRDAVLYPKVAAIVDGMAWCEYFLGHYDKAEEGFREALRYDANYKWSREGVTAVLAKRRAPMDEAATLLKAGRYADALDRYERIIEGKTTATRASLADALAGAGWCRYSVGRYDDAIKSFRQAVQERKDFMEAYRGIGACEAARGRWTEAITAYQLSFKSEPDDYIANIAVGWCHYWKKDYAEAAKAFTRATGLAAGPYGAFAGLAWTNERMNKPADALAAFRKAVAVSPYAMDTEAHKLAESRQDWWVLLSDTGWSALRQKLDTLATTEFTAHLRLVPGDLDATAGLAIATFRQSDYAGALALAEKALLQPTAEARFWTLPVTLSTGKVVEFSTDLNSLIGWCKLKAAAYDDAMGRFKAVLLSHPERVEAACGVGWVWYAKGDMVAADRAFEQAATLMPGHPDAVAGTAAVRTWKFAEYDAAWALSTAGKNAEAIVAFKELMGRSDGRFPVDRRDSLEASIGWAEWRSGHEDAAIRAFERALVINPSRGLTLEGLGTVKLAKGDFTKASELLHKALNDPEFAQDVDVMVAAGNADLQDQHFDKAQPMFEAALAIDANNGGALAGLGWAFLKAGKPVDARVTLERAAAVAPAIVDTKELRAEMAKEPELLKLHGALGWAWLNAYSLQKAEACFRDAVKLDARERDVPRGLALALLRRGEIKESSDLLKAWFLKAPPKENPWSTLSSTLSEWGWALYAAQKYAEASDVFNKLAALHAGEKLLYSDPQNGLGWCALKQNRIDAARSALLKAVSITPRDETALKGLEALKDLQQ